MTVVPRVPVAHVVGVPRVAEPGQHAMRCLKHGPGACHLAHRRKLFWCFALERCRSVKYQYKSFRTIVLRCQERSRLMGKMSRVAEDRGDASQASAVLLGAT